MTRRRTPRRAATKRSGATRAEKYVGDGRKVWLLSAGAALCAGVAVFFIAGPLWHTEETVPVTTKRQEKPPLRSDPAHLEPAALPPEPAALPPEPDALPPEPDAPPSESASGPTLPSYEPPATVKIAHKEESAIVTRLMKDLPDNSDAVALMAAVCNGRGDTAGAVKFWKRSLQLYPKRVDAHNSLGLIALLKGEYEEAVALWRNALQLDPDLPHVRDRLARALMHLGRPEEAVAMLREGIERGRGTSQNYYLLGQGNLQLQEYEKAKHNYEAAIEIKPDFKEACYGLVTACARLGQNDQSQAYLEKFKRLSAEQLKARTDPDAVLDDLVVARQGLSRTLTNVGMIYFWQRHLPRAVECWRKAAIVDPQNAACRMAIKRAIQLDPDNRQYKRVYDQLQEKR